MKHRVLSMCLLLALALTLALPAAALLSAGGDELSVTVFAKNTAPGGVLAFSPEDFRVTGSGDAKLDSIVLTSLPDAGAGLLRLGDRELAVGESVSMRAVAGMRFYPLSIPVVDVTEFTFTPVFSNGTTGEDVTVSVHLLREENGAPAAEDLELCTYKNVAVNGQFAAVDPEGDLMSFQLVKKPARGLVTISEDGSGSFVYTPYENKTGKDSFTYVAVDSVGNVSEAAMVKVTISRCKTKVTYADMEGERSHKAAIRLAEEGIFVGECMDGMYCFRPELPVTRDQFLAMAMSAVGQEALKGVSVTGFSDDEAIPTWAKGYVSSALMSGVVRGVTGSDGTICFNTGAWITKTEATVLLDRLMKVENAADTETLGEAAVPAWAYQSALNMRAVSVLTDTSAMGEPLSRGEAAEMLCALLEYQDSLKTGWFG